MIAAPSNFIAANEALARQPVFLITIAGLTQQFTNRYTGVPHQEAWLVDATGSGMVEDFSTTISELDGGAELGEFAFNVLDKGGFITSLFPTFVFKGKTVSFYMGFAGLATADYCLLFTGVVDHVDNVGNNTAYRFSCVDKKQILNQVVFQTGDSGLPTDNNNPRTVQGHPLDILLTILETELGLPSLGVDEAKIIAYRDGIFSGTEFIFTLTSPPTAKDFIENELMKPLAGYLWTNNKGQLSVNFMYPLTLTAVYDFLDGNITESDASTPVPQAQQVDLVNIINYRYDYDQDQNKFMTEVVQQNAASIAKYGQYGQQIIESNGMRSSLQAFFLSTIASRMIFQRYDGNALKFDPLAAFWKAVTVEPGDIVTVTNRLVPDRATGLVGITAKKFLVLDRIWSFTAGLVSLLVVDASYLTLFGFVKIAPNGKGDYTAVSAGDKAAYMYLCNDSDQYSNGAAANVLG